MPIKLITCSITSIYLLTINHLRESKLSLRPRVLSLKIRSMHKNCFKIAGESFMNLESRFQRAWVMDFKFTF